MRLAGPDNIRHENRAERRKNSEARTFRGGFNPKTRTYGGGFTQFCFVSEGFLFFQRLRRIRDCREFR